MDLLLGVFLKGGCQRAAVTAFEENQELGRIAAPVPLDSIVHAVFPRNPVKFPDRQVIEIQFFHALILSSQLFDGLLAVRDHLALLQLFLLAVSQIFAKIIVI